MERDTAQRRAIRRVLENAGRPLGPEEVLRLAHQHVPNLGIATVYRNLKALTQSGWLNPVEAPGETQRYELAGKGHHHHFSCRACGRMFEVEGCPGGLNEVSPPGFALEGHELYLYGLCSDCNE